MVAIILGNIGSGPDPIFIGIGVVYAVAALLLWRGGRITAVLGTVLAILLSILLMTFAIPGLVFIATHPISFFNIEGVIFVILALLATLMVVSGVLSLLEGRVGALQRATAPRALGALAIATFLGVAALGVVARVGYASEAGHAGDLSLKMKDVKFSTDKLQSGSDVAINVANQDGTFHTFTIDGVVDKTVPASSNARVTFHLASGTYRYYCAVPGHSETMHGTLMVK